MSKLKIIFTIIKFILSVFFLWSIIHNVFSAESKYIPKSKSCEKYQKDSNFKDSDYLNYCSNLETGCNENFNPNKDGMNLLKIQVIPFVPNLQTKETVNSGNLMQLYSDYYKDIGLGISPYVDGGPLEWAKDVYVETQNAIYNCAIINAKIKVGETVIKAMESTSNLQNQTQKIKTQNENFKNELKKRQCNTTGDKTIPYNKVLLDNMTFHYCNYRLYLNYLSKFAINNVNPTNSISSKVKNVGQDKYDTNIALSRLKIGKNAVLSEITHAKDVYNMSFNGFNELEATYGSHIMLQLIYDDYTKLRDNLSKLLSPLSQLAYKIPNAQKQK